MPYTITTESGQIIGTQSGQALITDPASDYVTPLDIITLALKQAGVLGVGQTAQAEDVNDAMTLLNFMLSQWNRKRFLIYHLIDIAYVSTGAMSYTVGPGANFNCPRPDRLEAAFFRQLVPNIPSQIDYPLQIIEARETYNQIALKSLGSFPSYIFYDPAFPIGTVYPWPVPQANIYEVHLTLKETISKFTSLSQSIMLPPEYYALILYTLACRLRPMYQMPPEPSLVALAKDALATIRGANTQIARLNIPTSLLRGGIYNVFADTYF